ncbi:HlyD family efflux transporter periplasmic adaptor subunit [Wenyingzhuangia sp. IMCC45533]
MPNNQEKKYYYSESVRDYLSLIPSKAYTYSHVMICAIVLALIAITFVVQYPAVVVADCHIVSKTHPKPLITKIDGRIAQINIKDGDAVQKNDVLAYIESTAKHSEVLFLEKELRNINQVLNSTKDYSYLKSNLLSPFRELGEIQSQYQNFQKTYIETVSLFSNGYYQKQLDILNKEIVQLNNIVSSLKQQLILLNRNTELQSEKFVIDKKIYDKEIISKYKILEIESEFLNNQLPLKNIEAVLATNLLEIQEKQREILALQKLNIDQKELFKQSLNVLLSAIANWKSIYMLLAPVDGTVIFTDILQNHQKITKNTELMYVLGLEENYVGTLQIPQNNFGKVKINQKVYVKFKGYPFQEYGAVKAKVHSIAKIAKSQNGMFTATVELSNQNTTTNHSVLNFRNGMQARAEIITEDMRLIEQIFYTLREILDIK